MLKRRNNNLIYILGIVLIFFSITNLTIKLLTNKMKIYQEKENITMFFKGITSTKENNTNINSPYIAVLEIPKISLIKGIYDIDNPNNNVDNNIFLSNESTFPNNTNYSQIILASHSGNSSTSYFKTIHKIKINDKIYLYYNSKKYIYNVIKIYIIPKTGYAPIGLYQQSNINLITCTSDNKQLIVSAVIEKTSTLNQ